MNQELMIFGFVLAIFAYLVGIKKATWLLAGYNQKRVADHETIRNHCCRVRFFSCTDGDCEIFSESTRKRNPCFRRTRPAKYDNMAFENNVRLQ